MLDLGRRATSDEDFGELAAARAATVPKLDAAISASSPGVPVIGMPVGTSSRITTDRDGLTRPSNQPDGYTPKILRKIQ